MRIALGCDHRGIASIKALEEKLTREGHSVQILGECAVGQPCDYPEPAYQVGRAIAEGRADAGVLICGTGIGMSIAANKVKGVRAACVHDEMTAQLSRTHNSSNVICLSADLIGQPLIEKIVGVWIASTFEGGRHARRIRKIEAIEAGLDPSTVKE